jgi:hypothetical protein
VFSRPMAEAGGDLSDHSRHFCKRQSFSRHSVAPQTMRGETALGLREKSRQIRHKETHSRFDRIANG